MGLWTEPSSLVATCPAELFEQSHSPCSMPHINSAWACCLGLVSHHTYHRKQHCSLCKIKEPTAHSLLLFSDTVMGSISKPSFCGVSGSAGLLKHAEVDGCFDHLQEPLDVTLIKGPITWSVISKKVWSYKYCSWPSSNQSVDKWKNYSNIKVAG